MTIREKNQPVGRNKELYLSVVEKFKECGDIDMVADHFRMAYNRVHKILRSYCDELCEIKKSFREINRKKLIEKSKIDREHKEIVRESKKEHKEMVRESKREHKEMVRESREAVDTILRKAFEMTNLSVKIEKLENLKKDDLMLHVLPTTISRLDRMLERSLDKKKYHKNVIAEAKRTKFQTKAAVKFDISKERVRQILKENDESAREEGEILLTNVEIEKLKEVYLDRIHKEPIADIAKSLNICESTLKIYATHLGIYEKSLYHSNTSTKWTEERLRKLYKKHNGNWAAAARAEGRPASVIYRAIKRYGLEKELKGLGHRSKKKN